MVEIVHANRISVLFTKDQKVSRMHRSPSRPAPSAALRLPHSMFTRSHFVSVIIHETSGPQFNAHASVLTPRASQPGVGSAVRAMLSRAYMQESVAYG